MNENLKTPDCLFDAESLATHISIVSTQPGTQAEKSGAGGGNSMNTSSRGQRVRGSKNMKSSMKDSKQAESEMTSSISGSMNKTTTNQFSTETGMKGDFGDVRAKDVTYVDEELPESMMKAIKLIDRLLTQSDCHEAHVLYKDYPSVDLVKPVEEEENVDDQKGRGRMGGKEKKEEEPKDKVEEVEQEDLDDHYSLKYLFKFACDLTQDRQVSCMDINSQNKDLIAVSYGEFDIIVS